MKIEYKQFGTATNWVTGIVNGGEFQFEAKLFDEDSECGIDGGRVSKLAIAVAQTPEHKTYFDRCVANYDRGWHFKPKKEHKQMYKEVIKFLEQSPKRFEEE